jgi:multiple sugar transport system ATP-binding protein
MVFQNYALYPHKTVYANMAYGLKMRKFDKNKIEQLVSEAAEILGITDYLDRKPKALSGGQRQRVAVGRAIVRKPEVFLFDEPLSNLDAKMRVQMRAEISKLHHQLKTTIIYVTHDQVEAMTMGTRICVMKDGYIQQVDAPLEIYNNPANKFVAGFIGSPPMNFFTGKLLSKNDSLFFDEGNFCVEVAKDHLEKLKSYAGKEITFGIRPGHMSVPEDESVGTTSVKSMVEVLEPMGDDVYVYLNTGKTPYVARLDDLYGMEVGKEFGLQFNMQRAFFFDIDTEITIV